MAEVLRKRVIDFHSQEVSGVVGVAGVRKELKVEGDLTVLVSYNKQAEHQSRQDGGYRREQEGGQGEENVSNKKRQRGYEALQQPLRKAQRGEV